MSVRFLAHIGRKIASTPPQISASGRVGTQARLSSNARSVYIRATAGESRLSASRFQISHASTSSRLGLTNALRSEWAGFCTRALSTHGGYFDLRQAWSTVPGTDPRDGRKVPVRSTASREYRAVLRPRVSAGVLKQRSVTSGRVSRKLSSKPSIEVRVGFRDALKSPRKAAAYALQLRRDLSGWLRHMWAGIKLLAADVRVSWKILSKISHGKAITRRERNFIVQTGVDLARLVPFSLFLIIPAAEFALPFALRLFPNMLPSQFQSRMQKEEQLTRRLKANIELAKYLRDVVEKQAESIKSSSEDSDIKKEAGQLTDLLEAIRSGKHVEAQEVSRFAKLFSDELTLDGAVRPQLVAMCKFLGIAAHGTDQLLRFRLRSRLNTIKSDDMSIVWEGGADSLTDEEVEKACRDRGISTVAMSKSQLRAQLSDWLDMSQDKAVPGSLMVLSRAFLYTGEDGLKEALSSLPDDVVEDVTMAAGGGDGSNIDRLEEARRQSQLIEMESEREARKEKDAKEKKERLEAEAEADASAESEDSVAEKVEGEADGVPTTAVSESISDAQATAAAVAHEAKIVAENFTPIDTETDSLPAKDSNATDAESSEGATVLDGDEETARDEHRDEDTIAQERDAIKRVVDAFHALSSESAVESERKELTELKEELAEAESLLASMGDGSQSELRRFKKMVAKLEKQVETVDAKIGASMKLLDLDNDGVMSMRECVNAVQMLVDTERDAEIAAEVLRRLDADADGNISREDIQRLLSELEVEAAGMSVREKNSKSIGTSSTKASNGTSGDRDSAV